MEHTVSSTIPQLFSSKVYPYLFGASATVAGVLINKIMNADEPLHDLQKQFEHQSYIHEMRELYLRKDQMDGALRKVLLIPMSVTFFCLILVVFLVFKVRGMKSILQTTKDQFELRIKNSEDVIESILMELEPVDFEQIMAYKRQLDHQRTNFEDLIHNKSLELETKLADAKNTCIKAKKCVQEDLSKVEKLVGNIRGMKETVNNLNESLELIRSNTKLLEIELKHSTEDVNKRIDEAIDSLSSKIGEIDKQSESDSVNIFKCNSLLINAQILFEAAISKIEALESIENITPSQNSSSTRIENCRQKADELNDFMKKSNIISSEDNIGPTNAALYQILQTLDVLEKKVCSEEVSNLKNTDAIKGLNLKLHHELIDLKSQNDDWILTWVSIMYGLFSSSFLQLENQLFGIDFMEYITSNDEKLDDSESLKLLEEMIVECKKACIKIIKEVNLLVFEYYLIQKSQYSDSSSLTNMCHLKIEEELDKLIKKLEMPINASYLSESKKLGIKNTLLNLRHGLASDLKTDTDKFNWLVKQNLDDFYIIHETMKSMDLLKPSNEVINHGDSLIELSDYSSSLISSHNDESFSESDSSLLDTSISQTKLRPLKLADTSATKRKRLSS